MRVPSDSEKKIIVNADDFGKNESVTDAIVECFNKGYIDSSSVMVNMPDASRAMELAKQHGFIDKINLHLNLTEGMPVSEDIKKESLFCDPNKGEFNRRFYESYFTRFFCSRRARTAIREEIKAQFELYKRMGGISASLDSHHHVHKEPIVWKQLKKVLKEYHITSIRIARVGDQGINSFYNTLFNEFLLRNSKVLKRSDYLIQSLGEALLFTKSKKFKTVEIEVHPEYYSSNLIDRSGNQLTEMRLVIEAKEKIRSGD